jgi:hypothetical protein
MPEIEEMTMRKRNGALVVILIVIAAAGITKVAGSVRAVDMVQLTGSGACIGIAAGIMLFRRSA